MARQGQLAREVRAGLTVIEGGKKLNEPVDKLDELYYRKPVRRHVKDFAALFAAIMFGVAAYIIFLAKPSIAPIILIVLGSIFFLTGYYATNVMYPIWKGWMKFATVLGAIMTTLILAVAWMVVLIPVSLALRSIKKKVMNMEFRQPVETYWETREERFHDFKLLERQF